MSAATPSSISAPSERKRGPSATSPISPARIDPRLVNKRALETLAAAGAFDELGIDRATALANVDRIIAAGNRSLRDEAGRPGRPLRRRRAHAAADRAPRRQALGARPTGCRTSSRRWASSSPAIRSTTIRTCSKRSAPRPGSDFAAKARTRRVVGTLAGTVLHARERQGKSGNAYAFVAFSDPTGQFEAVVFSEALGRLARRCSSRAAPCCSTSRPKPTARPSRRGSSASIRSMRPPRRAIAASRSISRAPARSIASPSRSATGEGRVELRLVLRLDDAGREVEFVLPQGIDATPKQRSALKLVAGVAAVSAL